jgi:HD superfamily phosphodiesterase
VLSASGTAIPDFTLHDHQHAFRVAERMYDLLPEEVIQKIGSFELALLLLAAYLHDIGMSPTREVLRIHYEYILTAVDGLLSSSEIANLQNWLDQERDGLELPVSKEAVSINGIRDADEILSYYARDRHNDWGEDWVRKELTDWS